MTLPYEKRIKRAPREPDEVLPRESISGERPDKGRASRGQRLKRVGKPSENLWVFDIETVDWDQPLCAVAISQTGDRVRFFGPDCLLRLWDHMKSARGTYAAHFGGGFDIPLMLNIHRFRRIVLTGSNILAAEDRKGLVLRDTYPWFLNSLEKIGKALGVEKKTHIDRANLTQYTEAEILDYCEQDNHVLMAGIEGARAFLTEHGARHAWTAGASAMSLMRALEPGSWHALRDNACSIDLVIEMLNAGAVRGGRNDCFARGVIPKVYCYDIKSSYPSQYANRPLGIGLRKATRKDSIGVWRCRWVWPWRDKIPPAVDEATMAGVGPCESWLSNEEIEAFEECGVPVNRFEGWAP
jgi:hypothetical protein